MIRESIGAAVAAVSLTLAGPLAAQSVEHEAIEKKNLESGKASLKPGRAYIYITGPTRTNGLFVKTAQPSDVAEYETAWAEQFEKAKKRYNRDLRHRERLRKAGKKVGDKPVEPTEETFSIGSIGSRLLVSFGPQFVYDKGRDENDEKYFSYLIEVDPGEYSYYGPIFYGPGVAPMGMCYCMGSVKFEAKPGQVTSLGDFLAFEWVSTEAAKLAAVNSAIERSEAEVKPVDYSVPEELAEFGAVPADLRASGKKDNYFGIMIGRMAPIDGVLAYDRDTPIDVKGQAEMEAALAEFADAAVAEADVEAAIEEAAEGEGPDIPETAATDAIAEDVEGGDEGDSGPE